MTDLRIRADAAAQVIVEDLSAPECDEADAHHLFRVLRLRDGESVVATDGRGSWRLCAVADCALAVTSDVVSTPEVDAPVSVWLPALKGERSEWAVAKLTELGVDEIGLLACDRSVVRLDDGVVDRVLSRWHRVAREATCQSRRTRLPSILGPRDVASATALGARRCDLDGEELAAATTALMVGPEGGWSDAERHGVPVALAGTVLRTETAAVTAGVRMASARRAARHGHSGEAQ